MAIRPESLRPTAYVVLAKLEKACAASGWDDYLWPWYPTFEKLHDLSAHQACFVCVATRVMFAKINILRDCEIETEDQGDQLLER